MKGIRRETGETKIEVVFTDDGVSTINTGDDFLDHMLVTFGRYAGLNMTIDATGDLQHHLVEDVAITLGLALADQIPETAARYGWCVLPMDEALVESAIDVGGRAHYEGELPSGLYDHFMRSFAVNLKATLHIRVLRGTDRHHIIEAAFKSAGLAIRQAMRNEADAVFSTKGTVQTEAIE